MAEVPPTEQPPPPPPPPPNPGEGELALEPPPTPPPPEVDVVGPDGLLIEQREDSLKGSAFCGIQTPTGLANGDRTAPDAALDSPSRVRSSFHAARRKVKATYDLMRVRNKLAHMRKPTAARGRKTLFRTFGKDRRDDDTCDHNSIRSSLHDWNLFQRRKTLASYLCLLSFAHMCMVLVQTIGVLGPGSRPLLADHCRDGGIGSSGNHSSTCTDNPGYHTVVVVMSALAVLQAIVHTRWYMLRLEDLATFDRLWLGVSMWSSPLRTTWLVELASLLFHEPPGLAIVWEDSYKLNILCLFRFYIVARWLRTHSMTATQAGRIVLQLSNIPNTVWFAIKVWNHTRPSLLVGSLTLAGLTLLSSSMYIAEGGSQGLSFSDCLWVTFITGTTVGYGDVYPVTDIGKMVGCATACFGTVMNALVVNVIMNVITLNDRQTKAVRFMQESRKHRQLENLAAQIVGIAWALRLLRQRDDPRATDVDLRLKWHCYRFRKVRTKFVQVQADVHSNAQLSIMTQKIAGLEVMLFSLFRQCFPDNVEGTGDDVRVRMVRGVPVVKGGGSKSGRRLSLPEVRSRASDSGNAVSAAVLQTLVEGQQRQQEALADLQRAVSAAAAPQTAEIADLRSKLDEVLAAMRGMSALQDHASHPMAVQPPHVPPPRRHMEPDAPPRPALML